MKAAPATNRDLGLDLLRFMAIAAVLILHTLQIPGAFPKVFRPVFAVGWVGVDLFFVLSGFLIGSQALTAVRENPTPRGWVHTFWTKRWMRTLPLYFAILAVYAWIKPVLTSVSFPGSTWAFVFFLQNFGVPKDFVQSWSLCIEEQFYLVLPLVLVVVPRWSTRGRFWAILFFVGPIIRSVVLRVWMRSGEAWDFSSFDHLFRFPTFTHLDGIVAGLFLAATESRWANWTLGRPRTAILTFGIAVIVGTCAIALPDGQPDAAPISRSMPWVFSALAVGFSIALIALRGWSTSVRGVRFVIEWGATLSYGAYLWNNLWIRIVAKLSLGGLGFPLFIGGTFFTAYLSYRTIELPFLRLRDRFLKAHSPLPILSAHPSLTSEVINGKGS